MQRGCRAPKEHAAGCSIPPSARARPAQPRCKGATPQNAEPRVCQRAKAQGGGGGAGLPAYKRRGHSATTQQLTGQSRARSARRPVGGGGARQTDAPRPEQPRPPNVAGRGRAHNCRASGIQPERQTVRSSRPGATEEQLEATSRGKLAPREGRQHTRKYRLRRERLQKLNCNCEQEGQWGQTGVSGETWVCKRRSTRTLHRTWDGSTKYHQGRYQCRR